MTLTVYGLLCLFLLIAQVLYIRAARHWGLIDKPNERSLHTNTTTVRGGGIIFWLAAGCVFVCSEFSLPWFFLGLTLVAAISFLDDNRSVPKRYRLIAQLIGWSLALIQFNILPNQEWLVVALLLTGIGLLNAYNFMDGINGITAFYSLVTVGTLWYWFANWPVAGNVFIIETYLLFPAVFMSLLVFTYFNARKQAICFAGDVGSVSMGFIIGYGLLCMIWEMQSLLPFILVSVYGLDAGLTIGQRLWHRQNIFQPHRQHLFQVLVQEKKWPHLRVAGLYAIMQATINLLVINAFNWPMKAQYLLTGAILSVLTIMYGILKWRYLNRKKV